MKPTINKSRLMKEAHRLRKYEGLIMSMAMKLAWISEKKKVQSEIDAYLWSLPCEDFVEPTEAEINLDRANANMNYYAGRSYTMD